VLGLLGPGTNGTPPDATAEISRDAKALHAAPPKMQDLPVGAVLSNLTDRTLGTRSDQKSSFVACGTGLTPPK
jgi:hypothetical protein